MHRPEANNHWFPFWFRELMAFVIIIGGALLIGAAIYKLINY